MIKKGWSKTILLLAIFVFGLFLTVSFAGAEEATKDRALEIVYPQIPGYTTEKVVFSGLPEYIKYIFHFSVWLIGFVILGALIYAGFQYFTSFGNPEKFSAAKNGIISAFLGGIILLGAVLIFNTINPQLTILEAPPLDVLEPTIMPGIYLCNYNVSEDIMGLLEKYLRGNKEQAIEATKKIRIVMQNDKGGCFRVNRSGNLDFTFDPQLHTIFVVPRKEPIFIPATEKEPAKTDIKMVYEYGIIFHQLDNSRGKCQLVGRDVGNIYMMFPPRPDLGFKKAKSITVFQKLDKPPDPNSQGVILYECMAYNDPTYCPDNITGGLLKGIFPLSGDYREWPNKELSKKSEDPKNTRVLAENTRSIQIDPEGSYFAILFSEDNFTGDICEVISRNNNNLLNQDIGRCGKYGDKYEKCGLGWWVWSKETVEKELKYCKPCLKSMIVVKGRVL